MSAPPKTEIVASAAEEAEIRAAVRGADVSKLGENCVVATPEHVAGLVDLLADPAVSGPIYDLPRPINEETIAAWVRDSERQRQAGEALLTVRLDENGRIASYSRFTIWPAHASAEIAGAYRADKQSAGAGKIGAARSFDWMFEEFRVRLICVTAAIDNIRSARVIEAAGFVPMGERESVRPDGTVRRSLYWELGREDWARRKRAG